MDEKNQLVTIVVNGYPLGSWGFYSWLVMTCHDHYVDKGSIAGYFRVSVKGWLKIGES